MFDMLLKTIGGLRTAANAPYVAILEMVLIGLSVSWCMGVLQGTRGTRPLRGVLTVLVVATLVVNVLAAQFDWPRLALLYRYFVFGLAFVALVAFQPELRRAVIRAGDVRFLRRGTPESKVITALVQAARFLSKNKYGGLVAIQRAVDLTGWAEKGTIINGEVSANLLNTIFFPNTALHDLGVIIAGNRVVAANCQFPVAESDEINAAVGSRHLAALGLSYESDALVMVVSEETGTISLADNGKLARYLSLDDLANELATRLSGQWVRTGRGGEERIPMLRSAGQVLRRLAVVVPLTLIIWVLANQASQSEIAGVDVQLDLRVNHPNRVVDLAQPRTGRFKVTFRGTARAIEAVRDDTSDHPLRVDYLLPESYSVGPGERWAQELLDTLRPIQRRGLSVAEVFPPKLEFVVDELETRTMGVMAETGAVRVEDLQFEPDRVQVTLRKGDLERLPGNQRVVLPLEERLRGAAPDQVLSLGVRVPDRIGEHPLIKWEPKEINVSLRIVGQRKERRLTGVPVRYHVSPEILERCELVRVDPQEWLIDVDVVGDEAKVNRLTPDDVRASVLIPGDLLPSAQSLRPTVEYVVPEGIKVVSQRTVQLRIVRREDRAP